jgi:hypothetical protein
MWRSRCRDISLPSVFQLGVGRVRIDTENDLSSSLGLFNGNHPRWISLCMYQTSSEPLCGFGAYIPQLPIMALWPLPLSKPQQLHSGIFHYASLGTPEFLATRKHGRELMPHGTKLNKGRWKAWNKFFALPL